MKNPLLNEKSDMCPFRAPFKFKTEGMNCFVFHNLTFTINQIFSATYSIQVWKFNHFNIITNVPDAKFCFEVNSNIKFVNLPIELHTSARSFKPIRQTHHVHRAMLDSLPVLERVLWHGIVHVSPATYTHMFPNPNIQKKFQLDNLKSLNKLFLIL